MNRNDLIQMRNGWLQQASRDLSARLIDFMEKNRMNENELADALALSTNEVREMLRGAQNVTLLQFATLLIATGNVLRIEPIAQSPFGGNGMRMQREPQRHSAPQRDSHGRFAPRGGSRQVPHMPAMPPMGAMPQMPQMMEGMRYPMPPMGGEQNGGIPCGVKSVNLDELTRPELIDLVTTNHWDGEIDLLRATRPQIISFLESKNPKNNGVAQPTPSVEQHAEPENGNVSQFAEMIAKELSNNPQMLEQLMCGMQR